MTGVTGMGIARTVGKTATIDRTPDRATLTVGQRCLKPRDCTPGLSYDYFLASPAGT